MRNTFLQFDITPRIVLWWARDVSNGCSVRDSLIHTLCTSNGRFGSFKHACVVDREGIRVAMNDDKLTTAIVKKQGVSGSWYDACTRGSAVALALVECEPASLFFGTLDIIPNNRLAISRLSSTSHTTSACCLHEHLFTS